MSRGVRPLAASIVSGAVTAGVGFVLSRLYEEVGLLVVTLAVGLVVVTTMAVTFYFQGRSPPRQKVVADYRMSAPSGLIYRARMERKHRGEEPWPNVRGPFCPRDLSRAKLVPNGLQVSFWTGVPRIWVCPECNEEFPWDPDERYDVKGRALGRWNRGDRADWRSSR